MEFITSLSPDEVDSSCISMFPTFKKGPLSNQASLFSMIRSIDSLGQGATEPVLEDLDVNFLPVSMSSEYKDISLKESLQEILNYTDDWLLDTDDPDQDVLNPALIFEEDAPPPTVSLPPTPCPGSQVDYFLDPSPVTLKKRPREEDEDRSEFSNSSEDSFDARRFRSYQTGQWADKYNELCQYRQQKGHCLVPHTYQDNLSLARWVKRQRYQYKLKLEVKSSTMTDERILALEGIGFIWDSQGASWYERFDDLKTFLLLHKHCNVPSNHPDKQLATWVKCQRRQYKLHNDSKPSNMTLRRIHELEDLGFEWELRNYKKPRCS
jgi:hypothetical protein